MIDRESRRWAWAVGRSMRAAHPEVVGDTGRSAKLCPFAADEYVRLWQQGWRGVPFEGAA